MFTINEKTGFAYFMPDNLFQTQSRTLLEQMCAGGRWFDIRFSPKLGGWNLFHSPGGNVPIAAYSIDIYTAMNQIEAFFG